MLYISWVYVLFLMLDANFRLKLKDRGVRDTPLSPGWSYYVESTKYWSHTKKYGDQSEVSYPECKHYVSDYISMQDSTYSSELKAVRKVNIGHDGNLASGFGACQCARHGLVRRQGVVDLEKGEK